METAIKILLLISILLVALSSMGPSPRFVRRKRRPPQLTGTPIAVLFGSQLTPLPMVLLLPKYRAEMANSWVQIAFLVASPLVAYGLVRMTGPGWVKPRNSRLAIRALLLLTAVVLVELYALRVGIPIVSRVGPISIIAFVVTLGCLACWRIADHGYFPLLLLRDSAGYAVLAILAGRWHGDLALRRPDADTGAGVGQLTVSLLLWAVIAVAVTGLVLGTVRLVRWLRHGPPAWPPPPGVGHWPPEGGEVWNAEITHEDDNYKDRPVLVWEATPSHVEVLTITSVDKSSRPHEYLRLPLSTWNGVLTKEGWLRLEVTPVPYADFRNYRGDCPDGDLGSRLYAKNRVRDRPDTGAPAPGFALRHRFFSAMNKRVGVDARTLPATPRSTPPGQRMPRQAKPAAKASRTARTESRRTR